MRSAGLGRRIVRLLVAILTAATLLPTAVGASPVQGELDIPVGLAIEGTVAMQSQDFVLDLTAVEFPSADLRGRWTDAEVTLVTRRWASTMSLIEGSSEEPAIAHRSWGEVDAFSARCVERDCAILLRSTAPGRAALSLNAAAFRSDDVLLRTAVQFDVGSTSKSDTAGVHMEIAQGSVLVAGQDRDPTAGIQIDGSIEIVLKGAEFSVSTPRGTHVVRATTREETQSDPTGRVAISSSRNSTHALVAFEQAHIELRWNGGGALYARETSGRLVGTLTSNQVHHGVIRLGAFNDEFDHQPVLMTGDFAFALNSTRTHLDFSGNAESVVVGSVEFIAPNAMDPVASSTPLPLLAAIVLTLAAISRYAVGVRLYTRLHPDRVLDAPLRRRIYEAAKGAGGLNACEVAGIVGCSRGGARYHLRVLERSGFMISIGTSAEIRFFARSDQAAVDPAALAKNLALRDPTRRRLFMAVFECGSVVTQRSLAETTSIPRRLVSYHLRELQTAGLVEEAGGFPRGYRSIPSAHAAVRAAPCKTASPAVAPAGST
jgi:predicted transcriptional regulator